MYYGILIYVIGYILAYIFFKWYMSNEGEENTWKDVEHRARWSVLSWMLVLCILITIVVIRISDYIEDNFPKPPKWL